ncbi:MAG: Clp protease N-terminal domain-containing protein [Actinomycetota bacterium]
MFDRCDSDTMAVFNTALAEACRLGHNYVGTEHLLLALVRHPELLPDAVAARFLPTPMRWPQRWNRSLPGHRPATPNGLRRSASTSTVRAAVRQTFGNDAVERLGRRRVHQPWQPWRRPSRRCISLLAGTMGVTPRVKQAFEHARQDADRRQRAGIDPAGLLLGMVEVKEALSNRLLHDAGVDPSEVRRALLDATG